MKKIMIDMDDVICTGGYLNLINKYLKTDYKIEDFKDYFLEEILISKEEKEKYFDYFFNQNVYKHSYLIENAKEVLMKLNKEYDLYICTAYFHPDRIEKSGLHCMNKYEWLVNNLPFIDASHFVFINDKTMFKCDIKIDDRINNLEGDAPLKLLFDAWHNRDISDEDLKEKGIIRVKNWLEIEKILLED